MPAARILLCLDSEKESCFRATLGSSSRSLLLPYCVCRGADEDVTWSDPYANVRDIIAGTTSGREQEAYVQYIIDHYDDLANRTVFMHGRCPSCGFGYDSLTVRAITSMVHDRDHLHLHTLDIPLMCTNTQFCHRHGTAGTF